MTLLWFLSSPALAAEVVWLAPPSQADRDWVADQAGATGPPLEVIDLRAAATRWSPADQAAYDALETALGDARGFETKLDGELVIMRDLVKPMEAVTLVRDDADRSKLYQALAYQGFAVNRYFETNLGTDDQAEPFRVEFEGVFVERPWSDAVALDPSREITPYEIAEAPQRVAFSEVAKVVNGALPASLTPTGLPEGAVLVVDGVPREIGPSGNIKLAPGHHRAHIVLQDRVIARWSLRMGPGEAGEMGPKLSNDALDGFIASLSDGQAVPEALVPNIEALGGEVWIATPGEKEPTVFAARPTGVSRVKLERPTTPGEGAKLVSLLVGAQGGWFYSGDFLLQDPDPKDAGDNSRVNASSVSALLAVDFNVSGFHFGAGVQTWLTLGEDHFARTDDSDYRVRPYLHAALGIRYVQLTAGYLLPYHAGIGARVMVPIAGPVEVHASGLYGPKSRLSYGNGTFYQSGDVRTLNAGVGLRF